MKKFLMTLFVLVTISAVATLGTTGASAATSEFAGGSGTEEDPYLISTKEHLNNVRNYLDAHYKMIADIEFSDADFATGGAFYNSGAGWSPIGSSEQNSFSGVFDGNSHTISGLKISISATDMWTTYTAQYSGLFGYAAGTIKNISLINLVNNTYDHYHGTGVGGLVGASTGQIENVFVHGEIYASTGLENISVGGVAGSNTGSITNSGFEGTVTGSSGYSGSYIYAGGIAGLPSTVANCYNKGTITTTGSTLSYAGGISGNGGTISFSYNQGSISSNYAGGIVGRDGNVDNCYNNGYISASGYAGGISGYSSNGQVIKDCYNTGVITSANYGGGIIGQLYSGSITNCYNVGNVTATSYQGSIAGGNHGTVYAEDLIADGGTISNCYYPNSHSCGIGRGKDTATKKSWDDLKKQSSFSGFDFDTIWTMSGDPYFAFPELKDNDMDIALSDFEVTSLPKKTQYLEGKDVLNMTGAKGKIIFSNGLEDEITLSADMVEGFDNTATGVQTLTVKYGDCYDTFEIQIIEKTLTSISVTKLPNKTQYLEGYDSLNVSGGEITLVYNNGTTSKFNLAETMVSGFDNSITGPQQLTVTYSGKTTSFNIEIVEKSIAYISLESAPTKTTYRGVGDDLDTTGGVIKVHYNNKTTEQVDIVASMVTGFNNTILGKQTLTITYQGLSLTYNIEIVENTKGFAGGIGTKSSPFLISTPMHLYKIRNYLGAHFKLINDIVFTDADFAEGGMFYFKGAGWLPIKSTTSSSTYFTGVLDGNGYSIVNLQINVEAESTAYIGLFATNKGTIKNLGMKNCKIYVANNNNVYVYAGGFVGYNYGTISNCHTSGSIVIEGTSDTGYAGGIVGWNYNNANIQGCYNMASITSTYAAGGIASHNSSNGLIKNCYNIGAITAKLSANSSYSYVYAGGIVAYNPGTISCCYNIGSVVSSNRAGGITALSTTATNCYYLDSIIVGESFSYSGITACTLEHLKLKDTFGGFDFDTVWTMAVDGEYMYPELLNNPMDFTKGVQRIILSSLPNKLKYYTGIEKLDVSGGKIAIVYNDGTYEEIDLEESMISGFDNSQVGKQTLTVTYNDETFAFDIEHLALVYDNKITTDQAIVLEFSAKKEFEFVLSADTVAKITNKQSNTVQWGSSISMTSSVTISPLQPGYVVVRVVDTAGNILSSSLLYIEEGNHQMQLIQVLEEVSCTKDGKELHECKFCGYQEEKTIPHPGHTEVTDQAVEPTCTETGLTEGTHCSVCHEIFIAQTVIPETGEHIWDRGRVDEFGNVHYECDTCDATRSKTLMSISVTTLPNNLIYMEGGRDISLDGMVITAYYDDATSEIITSDYSASWGGPFSPPTATVTVDYKSKSTTFNVIVEKKILTGDTDGNEGIDKDDAIYLLMSTFFPDDYPLDQNCDFDGNNKVDKDDAIYLLMYTFFPEDYPLEAQNIATYALVPARKKDEE